MIALADAAAAAAFGARLAARLVAGAVVRLSGALGAGKTTLARGLLGGLGYAGEVPSPTFAIVQTYEPPEEGSGVRLPVWHVDLYRIEDARAVDELGLDEVLADGALIVEWPERAGADRWPEALHLTLEDAGDSRRLTARASPAWEGRWPI